MDSLKQYVEDKINLNFLNLDVNECLDLIEKYKEIYVNKSEYEQFFHIILNKCGEIINEIVDIDQSEMMGWLRVKKSRNNIVYYQFETEEDYFNWLHLRKKIYNQLFGTTYEEFSKNLHKIRLLNFMELSTMNFITDITTIGDYSLIDGLKTTPIKKIKYNVDVDNTVSFIKYVGSHFKQNMVFIPL